MSLPDSGGHYYDSDEGGIIGVARRNVGNAVAEITSGDAGGRAVGVAIGFVASTVVADRLMR